MSKGAAPKGKLGTTHFRDPELLQALGEHCRKLRIQHGYSIDRLSKEGEQLSPSVVHRLETGSGAVTVAALFRFAQVLGIEPKDLFDFETPKSDLSKSKSISKLKLLDNDALQLKKSAYKTHLPVYSLKAAAGYFGAGQDVEPEGWVEIQDRKSPLDSKMFVAQVRGNSMFPKIKNGEWVVFRATPTGSKQGKIVLAQYRGPADPETGGSYTVKVYHSIKAAYKGEWRHRQVTLSPINSEFEPILLNQENEEDFQIVAEYLFTL